ncbi:MAG: MerR family transcriptional regulator [Planctomycetes bacterium]|nr:MerR family transcriptional regulator [Planctomycetota bacterium]
MSNSANSFNIKDTSKATGLSPSVLRIWELRYGWPCPKRKSNGYRTYQPHQIEELRRVADLVKQGSPISTLIVDGLPRWPSANASAPSRPRLLERTRALPAPDDTIEAPLYRDLLNALETRHAPMVRQLLQRMFWTVRPGDEPRTALVPTVMALAELRAADRPIAEGGDLLAMIKERCVQLLRMQRSSEQPLLVVPARGGDDALAALTAVMLCNRGVSARPWSELREPPTAYVVVSDGVTTPTSGSRQIGCVSTLGGEGACALADLLDAAKPIPWMAVPTAR